MDTLQFVRDQLGANVGDLRRISRATGISYDTVLRIKAGEGDPGYSKVALLARYFERRTETERRREVV